MGPKATTMAQFAWNFPVFGTGCSTFWEDPSKPVWLATLKAPVTKGTELLGSNGDHLY